MALRHVVALRALGLGDLCTAIPALRGLRRATSPARLTLATPASLHPLADLAGVADDFVAVAGLAEPLPVTVHGAVLAVNLHGRGPESTRRLRATRPQRLVSYRPVGGTPPVSTPTERFEPWNAYDHDTERWSALVETATQQPVDRLDRVIRTATPPADHVVVHPGASSRARRWPLDRFAAVIDALQERGHRVVVTGSPGERALGDRLGRRCPGVQVTSGTTGILDLVDLLAGARLVVSGDTGVAHLAAALRRPTVTLYGPTSPAQWGLADDGALHTMLWAGRTGDPHGDTPHGGLLAISVSDVVAAVDQHLVSRHVSPPVDRIRAPSVPVRRPLRTDRRSSP
jgi:ADP-heptose:LPS heptosyltransferase